MLDWLQNSVENTGLIFQVVILALGGAIPFIESYYASLIGVIAGAPVYLTVPAAVLGNIASMLVMVLGADKIRAAFTKNKPPRELNKRQQKFFRMFDKYGVAGVSLIGEWFLPSQITSSMMAAVGVAKGKIIFWQIIAITLWGVVFAALGLAGVNMLNLD